LLSAAGECVLFYRHRVTWASEYHFSDPLLDLRSNDEQAEHLRVELLRELSPGHVLHAVDLRVIARALPQDEIVVETAGGEVALVHLTWTGHAESLPWPTTEMLTSAEQLEQTIQFRY
jgi:hypothetical protein